MIYGVNADLVGAELFGRSARLQLTLWILGRERRFWQQQAADDLGIKAQYLKTELTHLLRLGMIETVALDEPGERRIFYTRVEHPLWGIIEAASTALDELSDSDEGRRLRSV